MYEFNVTHNLHIKESFENCRCWIRITQNTSNNPRRAYASSQDMESGLDKKKKKINTVVNEIA